MSRRAIVTGLVGLMLALTALTASVVTLAQEQEGTPAPVSVRAPDWRFVVYQVRDPYSGEIVFPAEPPPGTRYIGAEVAVVNRSSQPLTVSLSNIRVRDTTGQEYSAGSVIGFETRLNGRTLDAEERVRGWVWFAVPEEAELSQFVFVASSSEFRVSWSKAPLMEGTPLPEEATPEAE